MPKIVFTDRSMVPEGLEVIDEDGKFVVDVVNTSKVNEFRDNNIKLSQERDTLKSFYENVSPLVGEDVANFTKEFEALKATSQQVNDGKLKTSEEIAEEVENRVKSLRADLDRQLQTKAQEAKEARSAASEMENKYKRTLIDQAVTKAAIDPDNGVEPSALPDILHRAYSIYHVENDGKLVPKDGEAIIYGSDGATPMNTDEWIKGLSKTSPHLFKRSSGGGANGSGQGTSGMTPEQLSKLTAREKLELGRKGR